MEYTDNVFDVRLAQLNVQANMEAQVKQDAAIQRKKKNHDFVQYSRQGLNALTTIANPIALRLFLLLTKEMNTENKIIASQQTLAEILGVTRQSISVAAKELIDKSFFTVMKSGSSTVYCLNADVVWTTYENKKKYATFRASVLVSESEQPKKIKKTTLKKIEVNG